MLHRPPSNRSVQAQSNLKTALGRIPVPAQLMEGLPVMKVNSVGQLLVGICFVRNDLVCAIVSSVSHLPAHYSSFVLIPFLITCSYFSLAHPFRYNHIQWHLSRHDRTES